MTLQDLYSIRDLDKEIADIRDKIATLRERGESMSCNLTGMPIGSGCSDKVGKAAAEIADYIAFLDEAEARKVARSREIHQYIESVEDAQLRRIMVMRFIDRRSWRKIAFAVGSSNTEDSVRKRCNRYVRNRARLSDLSDKCGL